MFLVFEWHVRFEVAYFHLCSNETIGGIEIADWLSSGSFGVVDVLLVIDVLFYFLLCFINFENVGMLYAGV